MQLGLSEIIEKTQAIGSRAKKIEFLRQHNSKALRELMAFTYDPRVVWELPEGDPPYNPSVLDDDHGQMINQIRKIYLFVRGGTGSEMPAHRREHLFIQLLESVNKGDALLLLGAKNKVMPKQITQKIIEEAFGKYE